MKWTAPVRLTLIVLACAACSSPSADGGSSPSGKPAATGHSGNPLCDKALKLHDRLAAIDTKPTRITVDVKLPISDEGKAPPEAPVVEISDRWLMAGRPVEGPEDVLSALRRRSSSSIVLAIGAEASLKTLPPLLDALADIHVYVVASPKVAKREPIPAAASKGMSDSDPSQRATALSEVLKNSISSCPPALKLFQNLGGTPHDAQIKALQNDLPVAVDSCSCKVDDSLVDTVAYLVGGDTPVVAKLVVSSHDPKAKQISIADLNGQKLYDALPSDGSSITLLR
jgi:hypothetical protein